LSGDKRFGAATSFSYKNFYYEIIKFTKLLSASELQRLLLAWDRCGITPYLPTAQRC